MPRQEIEVLASLGLTQGALGNYVAAYQTQMRRLKAAVALNDARLTADGLSAVALVMGTLGLSESEAEFLEKEVPLRRKLQDGAGEAHALRALGDAYRDLYRFADAGEQYRQALETSRRVQDREQEGRALAAVSRLRGELGDFAQAAEHGEQAVRLLRELALKSAEADATRELGKQYRAQGRHAEALAQFDASFKLDQEAGDVMGSIRDLDESAQDHLLTGQYQTALKLYQGSLKAYRDLKLRMGEADIHNKLGATLKLLGRYTEAEAEYRQSLEVSQELSLEAGVQQARANLAGLYATLGRYPEALAGYQDALAAFRKLRSRSGEATTLSNLGKLYSSQGDLLRAQEQHEAALTLYRELKDSRSVAQELHNLADLNADRARYAEALSGFSEALKIFRSAGMRLDEAITLGAQANVYHRLGQSAEALALYEQARQIRRQIGDRSGLAKVGASISGLQHEAGQEQEALKGYEAALATVRELGEKPSEASLLNNLSVVLRALGRNTEARTRLQEALKVTRSLGRRTDEAFALGNLAYSYQVEGRAAEAESTYREALKIADETGLPETAFRCWFGLGLLHRQQKQWRTAARDLAKATGLIDRIRGDVREQSLQTTFFEQYVSPFHLQAECLLAAGEPAAAYLAAERARARALVDVLRNGKVSITKSLTPKEREGEEKLAGRVSALTAELQDARFLPTDQQLAREGQLTESREALEQYRRQLFLAHPQLASQRGQFAPATLTQLNASLFRQEPGLCLLSYLVGYRETLLFAITRGKTAGGPATLHVYHVPITRKDLGERAETFWMECSQAGGNYRAPGQRLFQDLIQPAARDLAGKTQVVVVPDGPLHSLPFQALVDAQGKHLVERVPLSYAPSATALLPMLRLGEQRRAAQPAAASLLAFGRPKLDPTLSDLPATEAEVRTIARLFPKGAEVITGPEASEERFKAAAPGARCLHLATHGLVNEKAPLYSALALAHGKEEDGRLEARELMDLDLRADLVVLSACETALGKNVRGEGVLGLAWSLFVAGAPSSVVSRWQVEDETTGGLMVQFYRRLLPTPGARQKAPPLSRAAALRAAQLAVMKDGKHAHPYYWAPFGLLGDWRRPAWP
jgi:CHAT domain-containing protein/Flp pilus assembly protein TadD